MKVSRLPLSCFVVALIAPLASADNLIKNASFEEPKVEGRVDGRKGVSPGLVEETTWARFQSRDATGKVSVGMTDELARTGKQSIYVQFDGAEKTKGAILLSQLISIKGGTTYRVSLWGRVDRKRPLTLDQGRPYMVLEVEFYPDDEVSRVGDPVIRTQMIPGMAERLLFLSNKWSEYFAEFRAPSEAKFIKITFNWEAPKREGPADGIIFFDDAAVEAVPGTPVPAADPPTADANPQPAGAAPVPAAPTPPLVPSEKSR
ncbi:MAG: hypothetical protein QOE70_2437 [Chthoniobacter sp.]|jgi:hypothetical protein|nr:hypothetical protein [Chthoniobacter sp.]